jgi:hypothetical protein
MPPWFNSLDSEILTLGQLYRDRTDCENAFDELKNHWGWGGFTTQDLKRCRLLAASVALIYNWWSWFENICAWGVGPHSCGTPALRRPAKKVASHKARVFGTQAPPVNGGTTPPLRLQPCNG